MGRMLIDKKVILLTFAITFGAISGLGSIYVYLNTTEHPMISEMNRTGSFNELAKAVHKMGNVDCSNLVNQVTESVGFSSRSGAFVITQPNQQPNNHIIPIVIEQPMKQEGVAFISATFAPNQREGCQASYDVLTVWKKSCPQLLAEQYKDIEFIGALKQDINIFASSDHARVFLMQAGGMCVSIKKELIK
jgi:hypothetical protein